MAIIMRIGNIEVARVQIKNCGKYSFTICASVQQLYLKHMYFNQIFREIKSNKRYIYQSRFDAPDDLKAGSALNRR